ncbi:MAG TPA: phospholipase D-like domain-containing protein [Mycobacteriales bacterium]|nr:phospholipase D-like domain-containing protein [Mycobacteriales bacterium]
MPSRLGARRRSVTAAVTLVVVLVVTVVLVRARSSSSGPAYRLPTAVVPAATGNRVFLEPDERVQSVYAVLRSARARLDMTMYELVDEQAERILAQDAARGVRVRVLLDHRLEAKNNAAAYAYLKSHGVQVFWASDRYAATHQKSVVVDGSLAAILTLNLTSRYYPTTRDFGVVTTDPADVRAIEEVFEADIHGRRIAPSAGEDLVWSPGARGALVTLITSARTSIAVESEELSDGPVVAALVAAARRGVRVSLVMTYNRRYAANLTLLARAGVAVRYYQGEHPLYVHAKALVVDAGQSGARALVGSQNIGPQSLLRDRELGVVLTDPAQVAGVATVLGKDAAGASRWTG